MYTTNKTINSLIDLANTTSRHGKSRATAELSAEQLIELATNTFVIQRDHGKTASRKNYLADRLWGDQLTFSAAYVKELGQVFLVDGYNRISRLAPPRQSSYIDPRDTALVVIHLVDNLAQAKTLYSMFNSLAAAKRSNDAFDSGLREKAILNTITSNLILKGGRATAVQMAYGKKGSRYTTEAVVELADALQQVDNLGLQKNGEIAGALGGYLAVAQYCDDETLANKFIKDCNQPHFGPTKATVQDLVMVKFKRSLAIKVVNRTGASPNNQVFQLMLEAFVDYSKAPNVPATVAQMTAALIAMPSGNGMDLGQFKAEMMLFNAAYAAA